MPDQDLPLTNDGFLPLPPRPLDYRAVGAVSGIPFQARVAADWRQHHSGGDPQRGMLIDCMGCVSYSCNSSLECQLNWMVSTGNLGGGKYTHEQNLQWLKDKGYMQADGKIRLSNRWLAKKSGTTKLGNYLVVVADVPRKIGCVPESLWTWDKDRKYDWDEYYAPYPPELDALAAEFLERFSTVYEWVYTVNPFGASEPFPLDEVKRQLQHAPLQIATPVCYPWNINSPVQKCAKDAAEHATCDLHVDGTDIHFILDQYDPFLKQLAANYFIPYVLKIVIFPNTNITMDADVQKILDERQDEWVQGVPSGEIALIKGKEALKLERLPEGAAQDVKIAHRTALAAITGQIRKQGRGGIPDELFKRLPLRNF